MQKLLSLTKISDLETSRVPGVGLLSSNFWSEGSKAHSDRRAPQAPRTKLELALVTVYLEIYLLDAATTIWNVTWPSQESPFSTSGYA